MYFRTLLLHTRTLLFLDLSELVQPSNHPLIRIAASIGTHCLRHSVDLSLSPVTASLHLAPTHPTAVQLTCP